MITLNLSRSSGFAHHRAGWGFCLNHMKSIHSDSGLLCDDFIERSFSWNISQYYTGNNFYQLPYKQPWIGFFHNPPNVPEWFDYYNSPHAIINRPIFLESLKYCKGIIVLSDYLKNWLSEYIQLPIISLKHPTEIPKLKWCPDKFIHQQYMPIIQLGYWLRKLFALHRLNIGPDYTKIWLPSGYDYAMSLLDVYNKTNPEYHQTRYKWAGVSMIKFLPTNQFDELLARSIVFLDMYDSSANNAIIECIARNTPVVVNKLPAVVEYLGEDYPLYFNTQIEAESKIKDIELIVEAHEYLKSMNKQFLSGRYFMNQLTQKLSEIL